MSQNNKLKIKKLIATVNHDIFSYQVALLQHKDILFQINKKKLQHTSQEKNCKFIDINCKAIIKTPHVYIHIYANYKPRRGTCAVSSNQIFFNQAKFGFCKCKLQKVLCETSKGSVGVILTHNLLINQINLRLKGKPPGTI
eukprot:TRINITY_DN27982_c0_g2_i1.p1 TRINITY_DN27982_c0_g2~~TRINITY_DN27982_c0_g2_i1.p1  ORF type:complete len:141 (-),score=0.43 TRINITY_DN27982_c0_g2_i1:214-636(-)